MDVLGPPNIAELKVLSSGKGPGLPRSHPDDKKPIKVMKGKFGPYIKYKSINATIPDNIDPEEIIMEEAIDLIEKKLEKTGKKKKKSSKK